MTEKLLLVLVALGTMACSPILSTGMPLTGFRNSVLGGDSPFSQGGGSGPGNFPSTGAINTQSRAAVVKAYREWYQVETPDMGFTGNVQNCVEGTTSLEFQQATIHRINFYRAMVGLNPVELATNNSSYQKAALMMDANNQLSHHPPADWRCYSQDGAGGAGSSNLALGASGPYAIDIYIDDFGGGNEAVGHRRWILNPGQSQIATGDVPGANSLGVFLGGGNEVPEGLQFVAWPNAGFVPKDVLPRMSNRWSFSLLGGANYSGAQVAVKNMTTNANLSVSIEPFYSGYGMATLVFVVNGINWSATSDTRYQVTISGLTVGGQPKTYTYTVTVIDP